MNKTLLLLLSLVVAPPVGAAQLVNASGRWAAVAQNATCEAASLGLSAPSKGRLQARAGLSFDAGGPRRGQLAVRLSRPARSDASVMLTLGARRFLLISRGGMAWSRGPAQERDLIDAMRSAPSMQVEARSEAGGRFVDRFSLDGAPLAIDAAAACAARLANR